MAMVMLRVDEALVRTAVRECEGEEAICQRHELRSDRRPNCHCRCTFIWVSSYGGDYRCSQLALGRH